MAEGVFTKLAIACEYLDLAMQLYVDQGNYFCAIHLAATAEELFGSHLPEKDRMHTISWKAQRALHVLETCREPTKKELSDVVTYAKNAIKHGGERSVTLDPIFEARWHIEHALINFNKLTKIEAWAQQLRKSPIMWKFEQHRAEEMRQLG
jgi:hypothetical protein